MWKLSGVLIMTQFKKADLSVEFLYTWCWHQDKPPCSLKGKWRPRLAAHQGPGEPRAAAVLGSVREVQGSCGFFREWSQIHRKLKASVSQVGAQEIGARARIHIQGSQALGITPLKNTLDSTCSNTTENIGGPRTLMVRSPKQSNGTHTMHNTQVKKLALNKWPDYIAAKGWTLGFHSDRVTSFTSPPLSGGIPRSRGTPSRGGYRDPERQGLSFLALENLKSCLRATSLILCVQWGVVAQDSGWSSRTWSPWDHVVLRWQIYWN